MGGVILHWLRLLIGWPLVAGLVLVVIFWPWPAKVQGVIFVTAFALFLLLIFGSHLITFWDMGRKIGRDHQAGLRWWRNPSLTEALLIIGLMLFLGAMFKNPGAVQAWVIYAIPVTAVAVIIYLLLRRLQHLRRTQPQTWRQIVREEWRLWWKVQFLGSSGDPNARVLSLIEKFNPADAQQLEDLLISARRSEDNTIKALAGNALWRYPSTKELGRPLLEEAAAAGDSLALSLIQTGRVQRCDFNDPEAVQALADEAMAAPTLDLAYDLGMRLMDGPQELLGRKLLQRVMEQASGYQADSAKLQCLDDKDPEAVCDLADEAMHQTGSFLAAMLGMRLKHLPEHKALARELMVWAAEKDPSFQSSLQLFDDFERLESIDFGNPQVRKELEVEACNRADAGGFAVTLAAHLLPHDVVASRRLLLWAEAQGNDYARRMLEDFEEAPRSE